MRRNVKGSFDEKKTGTLTKPFIDFFLVFVQNKMDPLSLSLICIKSLTKMGQGNGISIEILQEY